MHSGPLISTDVSDSDGERRRGNKELIAATTFLKRMVVVSPCFLILHQILTESMESPLNLLEETMTHFREGAKAVRAHTNDATYIITQTPEGGQYWVTMEEGDFQKIKTDSLDSYFKDVFGIEAKY